MITLREKKLLNEHVTNETKRCLGLVLRELKPFIGNPHADEGVVLFLKDIAESIVRGAPYLEFHPELKEKLPK
ncbi:MAG: hypothetical protein ACXABY_12375 [Candidatus Thorarchaeota archaeon]|jgi:hypothetical protein